MWPKVISFTIIFFLLALLQARFFSYFSFWGASLNLVFITFFLLAFLGSKKSHYQNIYFSFLAGFLLDCFSVMPFGVYIISFFAIKFFIKKMQENLKETNDKFPFSHFALLFLISFVFNELFSALIFYLSNHLYPDNLNWILLATIFYNFILGSGVFFIAKKFKNINI